MIGQSKRKVYKTHAGAHVLTLPKEWAETLSDKEVLVVYSDILWVFPKERIADVDRIMEKLIEKITGVKITE